MRPSVFRTTWVAVCLMFAACGAGAEDGDGDSDDGSKLPLTAEIPASTLTAGFFAGRLREQVEVPEFRISKYPVTRRDYERCVSAGACQAVKKPDCDLGDHGPLARFATDEAKSPALCVGVKGARAFCKWSNARLPTLNQWFLAARGTEPRLHAWGDVSPTCQQHPRAQRMVPPAGPEDEGALVRMAPCAVVENEGKLVVAKHKTGESPFGVGDVLMTPGELVATDETAQFSACGQGFEGCVVTGNKPGTIESVVAISAASKGDPALPPYAFRCVEVER
jgi:hypothetical protein